MKINRLSSSTVISFPGINGSNLSVSIFHLLLHTLIHLTAPTEPRLSLSTPLANSTFPPAVSISPLSSSAIDSQADFFGRPFPFFVGEGSSLIVKAVPSM